MSQNINEPMLEMFIFETTQLLEQLEQIVMRSEKNDMFDNNDVNEVFRIMHTIKGSSSMMLVNEVATLTHSLEDIFYQLRSDNSLNFDCSELADIILESIDFIKDEVGKMQNGTDPDGVAQELINRTKSFLENLKLNVKSDNVAQEKPKIENQQYYISADKNKSSDKENYFLVTVFFDAECDMENIRAYTIVNFVKDIASEIQFKPQDILENDQSVDVIKKDGFKLWFKTEAKYSEVEKLIDGTQYLKKMEVKQLDDLAQYQELSQEQTRATINEIFLSDETIKPTEIIVPQITEEKNKNTSESNHITQEVISVQVAKLDMLMDLVGELVIATAMVTENPDLQGLELDNFQKASRQLSKITSELQDSVMSIRMVPLAGTFQKMNRIVRDMSKKLNKKAELVLIGEETEVDKNVIEHISDPLMHLIRNSLDHGVELPDERTNKGKNPVGTVTLEAKNTGSEVIISISDDGKGLDRDKILTRAKENNLLRKPENEYSDKEIYNFIIEPGFSTKEKITEFSGRGVGMDVVMQNINAIGGNIIIDSTPGSGSIITLKIPLTLAIMEGMIVAVGKSSYTIPINTIRETFRPTDKQIIIDPDGTELIMVRGECYPTIRLHNTYNIETAIKEFTEGIVIMVETDHMTIGVLADKLITKQSIVVKPIPLYIKNINNIKGIAGCTLLGDGSISLIIDPAGLSSRIN